MIAPAGRPGHRAEEAVGRGGTFDPITRLRMALFGPDRSNSEWPLTEAKQTSRLRQPTSENELPSGQVANSNFAVAGLGPRARVRRGLSLTRRRQRVGSAAVDLDQLETLHSPLRGWGHGMQVL